VVVKLFAVDVSLPPSGLCAVVVSTVVVQSTRFMNKKYFWVWPI